MRFRSAIHLSSLLWLICLAGYQTASAQDAPDPQSPQAPNDRQTAQAGDIIFVEIELTPEGTVAYDDEGNRWRYSYNQQLFVLDVHSSDIGGQDPGDEGARDERVETRCTEELIIDGVATRSLFVGYDEYVEGNIRSLDRVTVKGWAKGNVTSSFGRVVVTSSGRVDGDVRAPEIDVKRGGIIRGEQIVTNELTIPDQFTMAGIWIVFGFTLALLIVAFVAGSLAPRQLQNFTQCMHRYKVKSFFLGFLSVILLPMVVGILAVTVVGIVLIPLVPVALLMSLALGMCAMGAHLTPLIYKGSSATRPLMNCFIGVMAYMLLWALVAVVLGSGPEGSGVTGWGIPLLVISILATAYPFMAGIGTALMTRFGYRQYVSYRDSRPGSEEAAPAPAPPPILDTPSESRPAGPDLRSPTVGKPPSDPGGPIEST